MLFDVYIDNKHLGSFENIITERGKEGLLDYVAKKSGTWAGAMSVGVGETPPVETDEFLDFEVKRVDIETTEVDKENSIVIFKATFPQELILNIREFGLHSLVDNPDEDESSQIIASFDPLHDGFEGTFTETDVRVGLSALTLSSGESSIYEDFHINLDQYKNTDKFILAATGGGDVEIRFKRNSTNYFSVAKTVPTGYSFVEMTKADFSETGNPDWEDIRSLEFVCTSGSVALDAFSVRDVDAYDEFYLASRALASDDGGTTVSPIQKNAGQELNIEYRVKLTVE